MLKKVGILFFLMGVFLFAQNGKEIFFNFEKNTEIWRKTSTKGNCVDKISISDEKSIDGKKSLKVDFNLPGEGCIESSFFKDLSVYCLLQSSLRQNRVLNGIFKRKERINQNSKIKVNTPVLNVVNIIFNPFFWFKSSPS